MTEERGKKRLVFISLRYSFPALLFPEYQNATGAQSTLHAEPSQPIRVLLRLSLSTEANRRSLRHLKQTCTG